MNGSESTLISAELAAEFEELASRYPEKRAALLPILHRMQEVHGWISPEVMEAVASWIGLAPVEIEGVVTFYPMFRRRPAGRHIVSVCKNISCHLCGAEDVLAAIEKRFGLKPGDTTSDGRITLLAVQCLGACGYGPMMDVDGTYHEHLTPETAVEILEGLE